MLNDTLGTLKKAKDVIAMPETKLHDYAISNIRQHIGLDVFNTNSINLAECVGIYLAEELNFINRCDLNFLLKVLGHAGSR